MTATRSWSRIAFVALAVVSLGCGAATPPAATEPTPPPPVVVEARSTTQVAVQDAGQSAPEEEIADPLAGVTPRTLGPQEVSALQDALPFDLTNISLVRIDRFLRLYAAIAAGEDPMPRNSVSGSMKRVFAAMKRMEKLSTQRTFPNIDGLTANNIISWAIPPASGKVLPLAYDLKEVLAATDPVLYDFEEVARGRKLLSVDLKSELRQQHYIVGSNQNRLDSAISRLTEALTPRSR